jgi:hypothetical protein
MILRWILMDMYGYTRGTRLFKYRTGPGNAFVGKYPVKGAGLQQNITLSTRSCFWITGQGCHEKFKTSHRVTAPQICLLAAYYTLVVDEAGTCEAEPAPCRLQRGSSASSITASLRRNCISSQLEHPTLFQPRT